MGTAASTTTAGTDRPTNDAAIQGSGGVLTITDSANGTAADGGNAGIPSDGSSPKISAGSGSDAVGATGTTAPTDGGTGVLFSGGFFAAAPIDVLVNIAKAVPHEDGAAGVIADLLASRPGNHQDDLAEFQKAYLHRNDSALEHIVRLSVDLCTQDEAKRLLAAYKKANRAYVARCYAKQSKSGVLLPPHSTDDGGRAVFNRNAVFCYPSVALILDDWPMLKRALAAGRLDVNAEYNIRLRKGGDDIMRPLLRTSFTWYSYECFKGLLDRDDIELVESAHREDLFSSLFGFIMQAQAHRADPLRKGDMDLLEYFIRHPKCDVNVIDVDGSTPLHWIVQRLTLPSNADGSGPFLHQLDRLVATTVVLVRGGADVNGGAAHQLSPQSLVLDWIASENPAVAARCHLALAAMRGQIDLADCFRGLDKAADRVTWLLSYRLGFLVAPFLFSRRMFHGIGHVVGSLVMALIFLSYKLLFELQKLVPTSVLLGVLVLEVPFFLLFLLCPRLLLLLPRETCFTIVKLVELAVVAFPLLLNIAFDQVFFSLAGTLFAFLSCLIASNGESYAGCAAIFYEDGIVMRMS